jgi:L-asparaginase
VALIKIYPGIESTQLTAVVDAGARGIVLEGTGASNVPISLFAAINELTSWDIPVVVASRCRTREASLAEIGDGADLVAKMGAIGARGLAPVKARAALMVALGSGGVDAVREWFSRV